MIKEIPGILALLIYCFSSFFLFTFIYCHMLKEIWKDIKPKSTLVQLEISSKQTHSKFNRKHLKFETDNLFFKSSSKLTLTRHEYSKEKCQSRGRRNILQFGRLEKKDLGNEEPNLKLKSLFFKWCQLVKMKWIKFRFSKKATKSSTWIWLWLS